jgi:hypothetical protein
MSEGLNRNGAVTVVAVQAATKGEPANAQIITLYSDR